MKNLNGLKGIINVFSDSKNFFEDYTFVSRSLVYRTDPKSKIGELETGLLLSDTNETKFLKVHISSSAYIHLMSYSNPSPSLVPTHTGLINIITNFFGIEVLCAFVKRFDGIGDCESGIVMISDKKIFCVDAYIHDIVALSMVKKFPIFIRRSIYDNHGMKRNELKGYF